MSRSLKPKSSAEMPYPCAPSPRSHAYSSRIIRFRVIAATGQEIVSKETVVCQRKQGAAVELRLFANGSTQIRKFLPPLANLKRLLGGGGTP
jgi:hypothetical protein